jgi:hypothetical protein
VDAVTGTRVAPGPSIAEVSSVGTEHDPPRPDLSGSLSRARALGFVGRRDEVRAFIDAMDGSSEALVLFVHGPGGIGKTTLLEAYARHARDAGRSVVYLDAHDVEASAASVTSLVMAPSGRQGSGASPQPDVLLVDGYELFDPLDRWFREELLPARPAGSVTVLAGRSRPRTAWTLDPGWHRLLRVLELGELDARESDDLLAALGVEEARRGAMAALAHGSPLALALVAEASADGPVPESLAAAPQVVAELCRLIVDDVPDAAHRSGLATCAHATRMTQDLLARVVGPHAEQVWAWLVTRPYVRQGSVGLFLHDVVREAFESELTQRSPDAYTTLHATVRDYFLQRLVDPAEPHPDRAAAEILLLHRRSPLATTTTTLRRGGILSVVTAGPEEREEVLALIAAGEGHQSAELARRWVTEQPRSLYCVRSQDGVLGFSVQVYLPVGGTLDVDDPVAAAVMQAVEKQGALRPGERVHVNRFAGAAGRYQGDPLQLLVNGVACILEWSSRPAAWTFIVPFADDEYGRYFEYLGMTPMALGSVGGRVAYGWDRRRFPISAFFDMAARRELTGESGPPPAELLRPVPLSHDEFDAAVRAALVELDRPDRLAGSPLVGSALTGPGAAGGAEPLRSTIVAAIRALGDERRGAEHRRVLERTYTKGAPTQEVAAQLLDLPFSTYRRHLAQAQDRLVELLWSVEIGERPPPGGEVGSD